MTISVSWAAADCIVKDYLCSVGMALWSLNSQSLKDFSSTAYASSNSSRFLAMPTRSLQVVGEPDLIFVCSHGSESNQFSKLLWASQGLPECRFMKAQKHTCVDNVHVILLALMLNTNSWLCNLCKPQRTLPVGLACPVIRELVLHQKSDKILEVLGASRIDAQCFFSRSWLND